MLALSLVKSIEIIGEAANNVSAAYRENHPEIPWREMIDTRHRLIHHYFKVNFNVVWKTLMVDLPPLIASLEKLLQEAGEA